MPVVMGTAGHIDHGKTSLVRRLTGVDCDRLEEEKRRGITIELGFASLPLPGGRGLSIIDVPGHERFVRNMVAGAAGIDFVMLVIAADEGVMPQTREHIEICSLLGIRHGLVALTKVDMVDEELLTLAAEDVSSFLCGTCLEGAPIFPVSSLTGQGMDALVDALAEREKHLAPERRSDLLRLPVDRVFTMRGHGTVVTGTLISGTARVGDEVVVYPSMLSTRIRGLQSHGETTDVAPAGRRTAVNLQGVEVEAVHRGEVLGRPGTLFPSRSWVVELTCLSSSPRPLRHRMEVHFHHGSAERQARLYFFDRDTLPPGESGLCEVRFTEPLAGVFGDRCVVRSFSPLRTVGGGVLLHPLGTSLRRRDQGFEARRALLSELAVQANTPQDSHTPEAEEARVLAVLDLAGTAGISFAALCACTNMESRRLEKLLNLLGGRQQAFCFDRDERLFIGGSHMNALGESFLAAVTDFHAKNPMKPGLGRGAAASAWGRKLSPRLVHAVTERLIRQSRLVAEGDILRLPDFSVSLASDQSALRAAILAAHVQAGAAPPNMKEVLEALTVQTKEAAPILKLMQDAGELVRVADGIWYAAESLDGIRDKVRVWFADHDNLDLGGLKEITGLSRKYLIALMEYFDRERLTIRVGDRRVLRGG